MIIAYYEWNSLKILVIGEAGFTEWNLVEFLQKNNQILVYDNLSSSSAFGDGNMETGDELVPQNRYLVPEHIATKVNMTI